MPCTYDLIFPFAPLSPSRTQRDKIFYCVKRRRRIQKSLRAEMGFQFREQRIPVVATCKFNGYATLVVGHRCRSRAKLRA